jgi:hypothetical protein
VSQEKALDRALTGTGAPTDFSGIVVPAKFEVKSHNCSKKRASCQGPMRACVSGAGTSTVGIFVWLYRWHCFLCGSLARLSGDYSMGRHVTLKAMPQVMIPIRTGGTFMTNNTGALHARIQAKERCGWSRVVKAKPR